MPNQLTTTGLQIKSNTELVADLVTALQGIYGADINVSQNSPDGQMIGIFGQAATDILELLLAVYNSFSVENAFGIYLDQRVALNGIARRQGTHSITDVTISTSGAVNLVGIDALVNDPTAVVYTVADDLGVQYQLLESVSIGGASDNILAFQSKDIGVIEPVENTITNQVTVVQQVSAVNNPSAATSIGVAEETDAQLKIRHAQSFFLASTGPGDAIEAALKAIPDVTDAFVAENDTDSPANAVPAHSIWCIVDGGTDAEVGQAIYAKKSPGCGMKGSVNAIIARPNGTTFTAKFDRAISENLFIKFTMNSKISGTSFDPDAIAQSIVDQLTYKLGDSPTIGDIFSVMSTIEPGVYLTAVGVSLNGMDYSDKVSPSDFQHKFILTVDNIDITVP